jgi:hypothetical protein
MKRFTTSLAIASALVAGVIVLMLGDVQPAFAYNGCESHWVNTEGTLSGFTKIIVCHNQKWITSVSASHQNNGDSAHGGHLYIGDNNNQGWTGQYMSVAPGDIRQVDFDVNQNWQSGHRVCAVWVRANGQYTSYACMILDGNDFDND